MYPSTQPHQRGYCQERWQLEPPHASAGPSHAWNPHNPLGSATPALPPSRPTRISSATTPTGLAHRPPQPPQTQAYSSQLPPSLRPEQLFPQNHAHAVSGPSGDLGERLVNPYEQREPSMPSTNAFAAQTTPDRGAVRQSFGPGDPLFAAHQAARAATSHTSDFQARPSLSSRPRPVSSPPPCASSLAVAQRIPQRVASSSSALPGARSRPVGDNNTAGPSHGAPGHEADDCPGCRAELEDAIKASLRSAQQEDEKRQRYLREQQELHQIYAANTEENERQRRLIDEEELMLQKAIQDSRREAEQQTQRSAQDEAQLLEESRQYALRQREQSERLEASILEAAKIASSEQEQERRRELDAMKAAEEKALELSLQEQEEEWARRESAERSFLEFLEQRDNVGEPTASLSSNLNGTSASRPASPFRRVSSASIVSHHVDTHELDAEYWRFAGHDEAYQLALQMQSVTLANNAPSTSASRSRRPLPQTPGKAEQADENRGKTFVGSSRKQDHPTASSRDPDYAATDDAPPAYSEATRAGPSNPAAQNAAMTRPQEKASSSRYDTVTLEALSRPVLQHQSSSSSSAQSLSQSSSIMSSPRTSFTGTSHQAKVSPTPTASSEELSSAAHPETHPPSIPQRGSSHSTPASKRFSTSSTSLAPEQRGQRALAGIDFGYGSLPFAPKLNRSFLTTSQSTSASSSSSTAKVLFPSTIELSSVTKDSGNDSGLSGCSFFVLRAHSWKSLLRAIAWYGNSRVEASPAQVAAASDRRSRCLLRAEVEFVTPTRVDLGYGVGEYARAAQNSGSMPKNPSPAHVALCLSLLPMSASKSGEASAWLKSEEYQIIKRESRRLDAWYAGKGSTRRLVQLARQPPVIPATMVQIAQLLHASHTFSAACPSSGSTARHSPRDLHHAIERHDEGFVRKHQAMLDAGSALASHASSGPSNSRLSMQSQRRTSASKRPDANAGGDELDDDNDDDDDEEVDVNDLSLLADGSFDAQDKVLMGKRQRLKAKVKRRLAKRNSDGRVVDEDLAAWITPFDLSQHG